MPVPRDENPKLRRALSTPMLTLYGLGVTVGAGIYVLVGATAHQAGAYASFSFLVAAIVVSLTALSYAELSTRYPVSAGEAAYVEAGFNTNWLTIIVGLAVQQGLHDSDSPIIRVCKCCLRSFPACVL